ncbi:phosphotransferase [Aquicoccus sp. G2-2]|uniref:phosphotransferase n=1 Tax=Aquicoccus sp. G2-2 TaxID=3092120 RepID=UPI002AE00CAF|nr:phosphotransferase [Aquicoccus sp. G2-2]MEA1114038.1 phosphotransferase [Aquicoccus sp. G2-2]
MAELAREAARLWGLGDAPIELAAQRENMVYRVVASEGDFALRFHRPGYRSEAELRSELEWTAMLAQGGLSVPAPKRSQSGRLIERAGECLVDLLTWLPGEGLGKAGEMRGVADRAGFCRQLGAAMARLHDLSDGWALPEEFTRPAWDRAGLLGEAPLWGRFWEHPHLSADDTALFLAARAAADAALARLEGHADYGLIHADLLSENMLWDGARLSFIDFDDGGFGFRDFELATFLLRYEEVPDYETLRAALCEGYGARRVVEPGALDLFMLLRALTYPGWIAERLDEPGAEERSRRAVSVARRVARRWLTKYGGA